MSACGERFLDLETIARDYRDASSAPSQFPSSTDILSRTPLYRESPASRTAGVAVDVVPSALSSSLRLDASHFPASAFSSDDSDHRRRSRGLRIDALVPKGSTAGFASWLLSRLVASTMEADSSRLVVAERRHVTSSLVTRADLARARARTMTSARHVDDVSPLAPLDPAVQEEARSSRARSFLPSFLPAVLSFRRYALCGAPVAPACTDRQQMASDDSARPRATPLRPGALAIATPPGLR